MEQTQGPKPRTNIFGYLDETGLLHTPASDRFFGMGMVTTRFPRKLHRTIIRLKDVANFHEEFKFNNINHPSLPIYRQLLDSTFQVDGLRFNCIVVDKSIVPILTAKHTQMYNELAGELIATSIDQTGHKDSEYIAVFADDISTADKDDKFEKVVSERIKKAHRRNALFGVCRLESHAVSEIQLSDVLTGATVYAYKMKHGLVSTRGAKAQFVRYVQQKLNIFNLAEPQSLKMRHGVYFVISEK